MPINGSHMIRFFPAFVIAIAAFLGGCAAHFTERVAPTGEYGTNSPIAFMDSLKRLKGKSVRIDAFIFEGGTAIQSECALAANTTVLPPRERPFADYVRYALGEELKVVDTVSDSAKVSLQGVVHKISLADSGLNQCKWSIDVELLSSNGRSLRTVGIQSYQLPPGWSKLSAVTRANVIAQFEVAVRSAMRNLITHPEFPLLLQDREQRSSSVIR